ncbi:MAG: hypothetical protein ABFD64_11370 [Armatimonadota bacterium]
MKHRIFLIIIAIAILVLSIQMCLLSVAQSRNDWLWKVQLVGQQGKTEADVRYWLGKPYEELSPKKIGKGHNKLQFPPNTKKVLLYGRGIVNIWDVYFFIGPDGEVLGFQSFLT